MYIYNTLKYSRKSQQIMVKNTSHFSENCKNRGEIMAVYIAADFLKLVVSNSRKIYILCKIHTTIMSQSHIPPVSNKAHGLW